jgi:acid phosphatase family membrane protein YuiD
MITRIIMQLLTNVTFLSAVAAMVMAQALKIVYYWIFEKNFNWHHFFEVGGMPSSHSAFVCCVSTMVGFLYGFNSELFSVSAVLSFIVMYDAIKVRPEEVGHTLMEVSTGAVFGVIVAYISYITFC